MHQKPTTRPALFAAAATLALTACGGEDAPAPATSVATAPTPTPSPSPSPTPTPTPTPTPPPSSVAVKVTQNIEYARGETTSGSIPLLLDIYEPDETCDAARPTVLFVHGGGFTSGGKGGNNVEGMADAMAARGINFVSIEYRLEPDDPVPSAEFQAVVDDIIAEGVEDESEAQRLGPAIASAFEDTVTALKFLETNADQLCVDIENIAYWGSSAGAFTVLQVGYGLNQFGIERPEPRVVVDYWGGQLRPSDLEVGEAPFFVIHGTQDQTVDYQMALDLTAQADVVGIPYALYSVLGAGHGFGNTGVFTATVDGSLLIDITADFVEAHLTGGKPNYVLVDVTR